MKTRFKLFRRDNGVFYTENTTSGKQASLRTRDETEARSLLNARNEAQRQPVLNLHLARAYRLTTGLAERLRLADSIFRLIEPDLRLFVFSSVAPDAAQDALQEILKAVATIPTGVAFDIHKQIERLRAKQAAAAEAEKAKPEKKDEQQVVEVTALPAPDNLAPETLELPPEKPEGQG